MNASNRSLRLLPAALALMAMPASAWQTPSTQGWPQWLVDAMQQEHAELEWTNVAFGDGDMATQVAGTLDGEPVEIDGGWMLSSDIGTDAALECWVLTSSADPASLAARIADITIDAMAETSGPVGARNVHFVDAGAYGRSPYLALEWLYTVGEAPNVLVGLSKVRVAIIEEITVACSHNLVGYRDTFERAFQKFVTSATVDPAYSPQFFAEVYRMRIGAQPIGVVRMTASVDEDGDTRAVTMDSTLAPIDNSNLATTDTWSTSYASPDGSLITSIQAMSENGELSMNLRLDATEDGGWHVSGSLQGKEIDAAIASEGDPVSEVQQMHAVRDLIAGSGDEESADRVTMAMWLPEANPLAFTPATFVLDPERRAQGHGTLTMGPVVMDTNFDEHGSIEDASMQMGNFEVSLDRLWTEGTPP